jgi:hemolysin activation/secretion protein
MQKISILFTLLGSTLAYGAGEAESSKLKGVLLVDNSSKIRGGDLNHIEGINFDGIDAPETLEEDLTPYLSSLSLTADGAKELCEAIVVHYRDNEDLRVSVSMPEQDTSKGVVQLVVAPERLGEVNVKNNAYTESETLAKWVSLSKSDLINEQMLAQDVGWMNSNPYRTVKLDYQPGEEPGVTNLDLLVTDKKSWKVLSGVDNTGTNPIGPLRVYAGFNVNDFIFTDHTLNFQTMTADHYSEYQNYTALYTAPLPWRNTLRIFGAFTATDPDRTDFPQKHRKTYSASARYAVPQWFASNLLIDQVTFDAGFDFKGTNTNTLFEDDAAPVKKMLAYVGQFASSVSMVRNRGGNKITGLIDIVGSPGRMLPHQTDEDFNNLRQGATPRYFYSRLALSMDQKLTGDWKLALQGRAQLSASNLIPSEQFSLGGYSTVRGYEERVVNGDNAICGNFEIKSPEVAVVGLWQPKVGDSLCLLGFLDAGYAWFHEAVADTPISQALIGVGPGLRYSISNYFTSRLDLGFPLKSVEKDSGKPQIHFNAILSY